MSDGHRTLRAAFIAFWVSPALAWSTISAAALATSAMLALPSPVAAHCPNQTPPGGRAYSGSGRLLSGTSARAIKSTIEWANPGTCSVPAANAFTLEGVGICNNGNCGAWVQIGWVRFQGWGEPHLYCEFHNIGGTNTQWLQPTGISHQSHTYKFEYDSADDLWDCFLDGNPMYTLTVNFSSGTWLHVQGETNSLHATIGKMGPEDVLFSGMKYLKPNLVWADFLPQSAYHRVDSPYGGENPIPGYSMWRNWTNAH